MEGQVEGHGRSVEGQWKVSGRSWKVSGRSVEGQWKVSGRSVEGQWKVMAGPWKVIEGQRKVAEGHLRSVEGRGRSGTVGGSFSRLHAGTVLGRVVAGAAQGGVVDVGHENDPCAALGRRLAEGHERSWMVSGRSWKVWTVNGRSVEGQ